MKDAIFCIMSSQGKVSFGPTADVSVYRDDALQALRTHGDLYVGGLLVVGEAATAPCGAAQKGALRYSDANKLEVCDGLSYVFVLSVDVVSADALSPLAGSAGVVACKNNSQFMNSMPIAYCLLLVSQFKPSS